MSVDILKKVLCEL